MTAESSSQQLPQEKFAEELDELDEGLTALQVLYEKYFLGIDRRPPELERKRVSTRLRVMRSALYGVGVYDAGTLAGAVVTLVVVTALATTLPTLKIARIDPATTLRED